MPPYSHAAAPSARRPGPAGYINGEHQPYDQTKPAFPHRILTLDAVLIINEHEASHSQSQYRYLWKTKKSQYNSKVSNKLNFSKRNVAESQRLRRLPETIRGVYVSWKLAHTQQIMAR